MKLKADIPAVILLGGRSSRIGSDKFLMDVGRGVIWELLYAELASVFSEVYLSCRADQVALFEPKKVIVDDFENIGPISGIVTGLSTLKDHECVFFVSSDLPFFQAELPKLMLAEATTSGIAVCARRNTSKLSEPLIALWRQKALSVLKASIERHEYSLQRILDAHSHQDVVIRDEKLLFNMNTMEDVKAAHQAFDQTSFRA